DYGRMRIFWVTPSLGIRGKQALGKLCYDLRQSHLDVRIAEHNLILDRLNRPNDFERLLGLGLSRALTQSACGPDHGKGRSQKSCCRFPHAFFFRSSQARKTDWRT